MTRAPWSAAQMMPSATSEEEPLPDASSTRTGMILAPGAAPATPTPLFAWAAMMPATCVPWPAGSTSPLPRGSYVAWSAARSRPGSTEPARSSCVAEHAGVDDRDLDARARRELPRRFEVDRAERPLLRPERVVRRQHPHRLVLLRGQHLRAGSRPSRLSMRGDGGVEAPDDVASDRRSSRVTAHVPLGRLGGLGRAGGRAGPRPRTPRRPRPRPRPPGARARLICTSSERLPNAWSGIGTLPWPTQPEKHSP